MMQSEPSLERLLTTPAGKQLTADFQAEQLAKRREAVAAIAQQRALLEAETPVLEAEIQRTEQAAQSLAKELAEANAAHMRARHAKAQANLTCDTHCKPHQNALRQSADQRIFELIDEIGEESRKQRTPMNRALVDNGTAVLSELRDVVVYEALTEEELVDRLDSLRKRAGL